MLKLIQNDSILNNKIDNNAIVFSDSKNLFKLKKYYINEDILITTLDNYLSKIVSNKFNKSLVNNEISIIYMYKAYFNVKDILTMYKDIKNIEFINLLVSTYNFYKEVETISNEKINNLKIIFNEYEKLLEEDNYITIYKLYKYGLECLKDIEFDNIYFENISELKTYELEFVNSLSNYKKVYLYLNSINNKYLINSLKTNYISTNHDAEKLYELGSKNLFKNINIYACNDLYEEVKFVRENIIEDINKGLTLNDILVVSPDIKRYESYFELLFDFPYQKSIKNGLFIKKFIRILKSILNGDFTCNTFLSLLKLNIFNVDNKLIDLLDNYIFEWDLGNNLFYEEFIYNPNGKKDFTENDYKVLKSLNDIRLNILNPIRCLLENIVKEKNVTELLKYIFMYIDEEQITTKLAEKDYEGYLKFVDLLELINDNFKELEITNLLDLIDVMYLVKEKNINNIDEVSVCDIKSYVNNNYKKVYFIGLTEKDIPSKYSYSTLINNLDIKYEDVFNLINEYSDKEKNLVGNILLNDNVVISYHKLNDGGSKLNYSVLLEKFNNKINTFKFNLNKKNYYNFNLSLNKDIAKNLYGTDLVLSPSSLEMFAKCKYSYFLNYGLKIKTKEKKIFDNRELGTFVHYILENAINNNVNKSNIRNLVDIYTNKYFEENIRNINRKQEYVISELKENVCMLIDTILDEIDSNKFSTKYTELKIKDMDFSIILDDGKINITGIVDRVDTYEDDKNYYYRIIDYKTGSKKFRLDDILNGLNMQMLIYLIAIKNSNITTKNIVPTGFLYYPALIKYNKELLGTSDEVIINNIRKNIRMNGILNKDYLELYDDDNINNFIDIKTRDKYKEEKILSCNDLNVVFDKVINVLKEEGNSLLNGDIKINPIIDSKNDSCMYCKFQSICKFNKDIHKPRRYKTLSNNEVIKIIEGDTNGMDK